MDRASCPVTHWQMITREPEKLAAFYKEAFGWTISADNGMGYRMVATRAGAEADGGIWPAPPNGQEMVQLYVQVPDIDEALMRIAELGGAVIMGKQILPDGDAMALASDPLGRSFGLMMPRSR